MKKRIFLAIFLCLALAGVMSPQSWVYDEDCIATAVATITTGDNANMTDDFTTVPVKVSRRTGGKHVGIVSITVTFTGDGSMDGADIDFHFQASYDNGNTYTTADYWIVEVESDTDADDDEIVIYTEPVLVFGVSHLRLWKVVNNDAANSITDVNATISGGR